MAHSARSAERLPYRPTATPPDCTTPSTRFRATVSYDGTDFAGWQTQPDGNTIQDVLEKRLSIALGSQVHIAGSGRTDAGVHARAQVFHFDLPEGGGSGRVVAAGASRESAAFSLQQCLVGLPENNSLPATIRVLAVQTAPADFHSRNSCLGKRYVYTVQEGLGCPFSSRYRWALGRDKVLDIGRMAEAAALLVGEHDFSSFGVRNPGDTRPPRKRMHRLEVRRVAGPTEGGMEAEGGVVTITAECDRYLYNMMRLVSGTLVEVGLGRFGVADVAALLETQSRGSLQKKGGPRVYKVAPPHRPLPRRPCSAAPGCSR